MEEKELADVKARLQKDLLSDHMEYMQRIGEEVERHRQFMQTYVRNLTFAITTILTLLFGGFFFLVGKSYSDFESRLDSEVDRFIAQSNSKVDDTIVRYKSEKKLAENIESNIIEALEDKAVQKKIESVIIDHVNNNMKPLSDNKLSEHVKAKLTDKEFFVTILDMWEENHMRDLEDALDTVKNIESKSSQIDARIKEFQKKLSRYSY